MTGWSAGLHPVIPSSSPFLHRLERVVDARKSLGRGERGGIDGFLLDVRDRGGRRRGDVVPVLHQMNRRHLLERKASLERRRLRRDQLVERVDAGADAALLKDVERGGAQL